MITQPGAEGGPPPNSLHDSSAAPAGDILVIGYGNELRGDDGAGPAVARSIEALCLPGVCVLIRHQLTPELAESIAAARAVVFVDACLVPAGGEARVRPILPAATEFRTHTSQPGTLLALATALYGRCPPAWLATVPATSFELGQGLSPATQASAAAGVQAIRALWASWAGR